MSRLLTTLKNKYANIRGFHTNRKLMCIESDDWGSIRMPSKEVFEKLKTLGDNPQDDAFLRNDCLESKDDLMRLYDCLTSVEDFRGRKAVITPNYAVANPDFDNIDYNNGTYNYEPFYDTYKKYYPEDNVLETVKKGIEDNIFVPQLHCREHLNVNRWMKDLREGKKDVVVAFKNKMIGIGASFSPNNIFGYMDAFRLKEDEELSKKIADAVELFERAFQYKSKTFVACCYSWGDNLAKELKKVGIEGIQSAIWQNVPTNNIGDAKRELRYTGYKNKYGQIYTIRNCTYEPSYLHNPEESKNKCLQEIKQSFASKKPAIICSHRMNYIGTINEQNAEDNLKYLRVLLEETKKEFPDVEFVSSAEMLDIIKKQI